MKNIMSLLLSFSIIFSYANDIEIKSNISKVIVFRNGAQITRNATVSFHTGSNEVIFTDLPAGFDQNSISIQVIDPTLEISTISYRNNYARTFESNSDFVSLTVQLESLTIQKENESVLNSTFREEENLILTNKKVAGESTGLSPEDLIKTADFYRTRLLEVKQKILESDRKIKELDKKISALTRQINDIKSKHENQTTSEIVVSVISKRNTSCKVQLSYIDYRAAWNTSFDLKLESLSKPLNLVNKAKVKNFTGEDWSDVDLVLSTGNPSRRIQYPNLNPWFLYYIEPAYALYEQGAAYPESVQVRAKNMRASDKMEVADGIPVSVAENISFLEYTIDEKTFIPSDQKEHEVKLNDNEIEAKYQYIAVPKIDNNVYLKADISDWEQYNLSSGDVKLFFEGTYVGKSYLNANEISDTLSISLGPDIAIALERKKLTELKKTSFFSGKKNLISGYEISLKNNKPNIVEIIIIDQIPLSTDQSMNIDVEDISGGQLNKETGIIKWTVSLKPGEQIKKRFSYTVKIPQDKKVNL